MKIESWTHLPSWVDREKGLWCWFMKVWWSFLRMSCILSSSLSRTTYPRKRVSEQLGAAESNLFWNFCVHFVNRHFVNRHFVNRHFVNLHRWLTKWRFHRVGVSIGTVSASALCHHQHRVYESATIASTLTAASASASGLHRQLVLAWVPELFKLSRIWLGCRS